MEYGAEAMNKVQIVIRTWKETEVTVCAGGSSGWEGGGGCGQGWDSWGRKAQMSTETLCSSNFWTTASFSPVGLPSNAETQHLKTQSFATGSKQVGITNFLDNFLRGHITLEYRYLKHFPQETTGIQSDENTKTSLSKQKHQH